MSEKTIEERTTEINRQALYKFLINSSILYARRGLGTATSTFDGNRNVYDALGYPPLDGINFSDYYHHFKRQDVAGRIVTKPAEDSWRKLPIVRGVDDRAEKFRKEWETLEKSKQIYSKMIRGDILSGIGRYGVLLLGFDDTDDFSLPVERASNLLYVQPYTEENAPIKSIVTDRTSENYGQPETYGLKLDTSIGGINDSSMEMVVHSSRVIHFSDELLENNIYGTSRLERVYNRLLNMELIVGGSAEMFWQGAFPGMAFNADPDATNFESIKDSIEEEIKKYVHNLERYMKLQGIDVKSLAPAVADPTNHIEVQMKMISVATGIPKRILEGSERGELSSSQDSESWDFKCDHRRVNFNEPYILRPVIDKLIDVQVLPDPGEYVVEWPDLSEPTQKDKAELGKVRTEAITKYASTVEAQYIVPPEQFLKEIMELPADKVERIVTEMNSLIDDMSKQEQ